MQTRAKRHRQEYCRQRREEGVIVGDAAERRQHESAGTWQRGRRAVLVVVVARREIEDNCAALRALLQAAPSWSLLLAATSLRPRVARGGPF